MTRLDEHGPVGARLVVLPLIPLEHRCEDHQRGGAFVEELAGQIPPDAGRPLVPGQPLERMVGGGVVIDAWLETFDPPGADVQLERVPRTS